MRRVLRRLALSELLYGVLLPFIVFDSCNPSLEGEELSSVPEYYFENDYLDNRIRTINDAIAECSEGCETFFWITDIHWEPELNARKSPLLIKYLAQSTGINKILNGGDTGDSQVICENCIAQLNAAIGSNKVYTVTGNHEIIDASKYENPYQRVDNELRSHNTDIVYGDGDGNRSYFYYDNREGKTRYIGLASFGIYRNNDCESCYTPQQLDWFKNTALNVEEGWTIVIFTHALYNVSCATDKMYVYPTGAYDFIAAIDNYNGSGKIACVLIGHTHRDRIHIGPSGIPYVISASDRFSPYLDDINVRRIPGTISEQHFEVVVIDKGKKQIKMIAIGANARDGYDDEPGDEVDIRTFDY
jgi:Calcineurin-like phosphoesterase.